MELHEDTVSEYIKYFFSKIVGFSQKDYKYTPMPSCDREFLSIAMDKIDRITRKYGKLRARVWSNCYFIFHDWKVEPSKIHEDKVKEIKSKFPHLFVRSYVYFVFINTSKQDSLLNDAHKKIKTTDYQIWQFNSKYELKKVSRKTNLFDVALDENETIDDVMYLANPESELLRIEASNSDAVDCVRAFIGDLELLEQTSTMLAHVRAELNENPSARILVEGPARSGKTIIAATILGENKDSKFLLMNYFFYQALLDGFHALSSWSEKEIKTLFSNPELDALIEINSTMPSLLNKIKGNLEYAIKECRWPKAGSSTKQWIIENISKLTDAFEKSGLDKKSLPIFKSFENLKTSLLNADDKKPFIHIKEENLRKLFDIIDRLLSGKNFALIKLQDAIRLAINDLIKKSSQKFFHHNINTKISHKVSDGCWIRRGAPTTSKMWDEEHKTSLIICDEVQRLGLISQYGNYDEFDEVVQILKNSKQSFFTGDNFQMLNSKYDKGIERINEVVLENGENLTIFNLPDSVGVPAEIGLLMKFITNPKSVKIDEVITAWNIERSFEIIFIEKNTDLLIDLLDKDESNKKHIACPMDHAWLLRDGKIQIDTNRRRNPIIALNDHEIDDFAYKFPYFCNEEIMPNYILSAYELISREVESLYIHIPKFTYKEHEQWYRKHLYVLFTRPTIRLVVNFDSPEDLEEIRNLIVDIERGGGKVPITFTK